MEVKFGVLATSTSTRAKSYLPYGSIGARTHWGQALVPLRDFPYGLIDFLAIKLGPLFMRHSRRTECRLQTWLSVQGLVLRSAPRRESLRKTFPLLTNEELRRNSRRRRRTWSEIEWKGCTGRFHLVKWSGNSAECPFFKPAELFVLLPTFFQTAPEISPCLQVPNAARSRETTRDVRQKLKAVLPSRAARERSRRAERAESVSIWATAGRGFWKWK